MLSNGRGPSPGRGMSCCSLPVPLLSTCSKATPIAATSFALLCTLFPHENKIPEALEVFATPVEEASRQHCAPAPPDCGNSGLRRDGRTKHEAVARPAHRAGATHCRCLWDHRL